MAVLLIYVERVPFVANRFRHALRTAWLAAIVLFPAIACSPRERRTDVSNWPGLTSGDHEFALRHGGRRRTYLVHVPAGASTTPLPVLMAFHGGGGNASGFQRYAELDRVADRERFIVVYPNGTGPLPNRLLTWNAGDGCCGYALTNAVNDMGFAATVLSDLEGRIPIDRKRVYATGHSNGAILAHRFAAERSGIVAAIDRCGCGCTRPEDFCADAISSRYADPLGRRSARAVCGRPWSAISGNGQPRSPSTGSGWARSLDRGEWMFDAP